MPATHHSVEGAAVFLCSLYCQTTCLSSAKHPANNWFSNSYLLLLSTVGCQKKVDPSQVCSVLGGGNPGVTRCCLFGTLSKLTLTPSFQILRSSDTRNIRSYDIFKLTWNEQVTKWKVKRHSQGCWSAHGMWSLIWFLSALPPKMLNLKLYLLLCFCIARRGDACQTFSGFFGTHVQKLWYVKTKGSAILLPLH